MGDDFPALTTIDYENNREERLPCIILVDGSGSMAKDNAIEELNRGLQQFELALKKDALASLRVQVQVIRFGETVAVVSPWCDALNFTAPRVEARGDTPMGRAVDFAMKEAAEQVKRLSAQGIAVKRPWIWLMSDGEPTDEGWQAVAEKCRVAQENRRFFMYPVSVITDESIADPTATLAQFSANKQVVRIQGAEFEAFFKWVTVSTQQGSAQPEQNVDVFQSVDFGSMQRAMPA